MIEVILRLPAEGLWQAAEALLGLARPGGAVSQGGEAAAAAQSGENGAFREEVFERLRQAQTEREAGEAVIRRREEPSWPERMEVIPSAEPETTLPVRRAAGEVGSRLSAPEPASYAVELPGSGSLRRSVESQRAAELHGELPTPASLAQRWERDSRRYDGGFPLY